MKSPNMSISSSVLYGDYGKYHTHRMGAVAALRPQVEAFESVQQALRARTLATEEARWKEIETRAARDQREIELLDCLRGFRSQLRLLARRSYDGTSVITYFPNGGLGDFIARRLQQRFEKIRALLAKLEVETNPAVIEIAEPLKIAFESYSAALAAHAAAVEARQVSRAMEEKEKRLWLAGYRSSHADLVKIFALDPRKANSFFASFARASNGEEEPEPGSDDEETEGGGDDGGSVPGLEPEALSGGVTVTAVEPRPTGWNGESVQ